jgi:hypothetical protein
MVREKVCPRKSTSLCEIASAEFLELLGRGGWIIHSDASGDNTQYLSSKTDQSLENIQLHIERQPSEQSSVLLGLLMDYRIHPQDRYRSLRAILGDPNAGGHKLGVFLMALYIKYYELCLGSDSQVKLLPEYFQLPKAPQYYFTYGFRSDRLGDFYIVLLDAGRKRIWRVIGKGPSKHSPSGGYGQRATAGEEVSDGIVRERTDYCQSLEQYISENYAAIFAQCQESYAQTRKRVA